MPFWLPNSFYFVTSKTFLGKKIFDSYNKKKIVLDQIRKTVQKLKIPIYAYSIAQNHHHSLLYFDDFNKHTKLNNLQMEEVRLYIIRDTVLKMNHPKCG
jgi:hypothetical protein